jgi:hypothetical protein
MSEHGPFEPRDLSPGVIARFGLAVGVAFVLVLLISWALWPGPAAPPPVPGAGLEAEPERALRESRRREEALLGSYGWEDRPAGVVRIPVDRAIEILAEEGLPWRRTP